MKRSSFVIAQAVLLAAFWLVLPGNVRAQVETILHSFQDGSVTNDGATPVETLIQGINGNFYGTTRGGGSASGGTIFEVTPLGATITLHSFGDGSVSHDGVTPLGSLVEGLDGNFYGTTSAGGSASQGTVFKMTPQGAVTILHSFHDGSISNDGEDPEAGLIQGSDGNFYGTTLGGGGQGALNQGTVFKITPSGTLTILHQFQDGSVTNDGGLPRGGLIQGPDGNFYGTTYQGGDGASGIVFKMTPQGTLTILHSFAHGTVPSDGSSPLGDLVQGTDGCFYGVTEFGVTNSVNGCAYKITPQGTVTILHSFGDGSLANDGKGPLGGMVRGTDGNFYGVTTVGGPAGEGVLYEITPQGKTTILHSFNDGSVVNDGFVGEAGLVQGSDGRFYGVTEEGGVAGPGTVFAFGPNLALLTSPATVGGAVALPFSYQVLATNAPSNYVATNLPAGLSINSTTGLISGTPTTIQTNPVTLTLTNAFGSSTFTLTINIGPLPVPVVTSILIAYGSLGTSFSYTTKAINDVTSYNATGVPPGLTFDSTSGILSGMPTSTGTFSVTLTATNATGPSAPVTLVIHIFATPPTLSQEYNLMHLFGDGSVVNDGLKSQSIIQGFDGNFYGVTESGGNLGHGAIYMMTAQGVVSLLYSFDSTVGGGLGPSSLIQAADGNFYGTVVGQIFKLTSSGQITLFSVSSSILNPLIQGSDGNFYGTTSVGGSAGNGTVFQMTPQGVVTILHNFGDGSVTADGGEPLGSLVQGADGNFYGMTGAGGSATQGTVFKITPQGAVTILHSFGDGSVTNDGLAPQAGLIQGADGNFYGTTSLGGSGTNGTTFKITPQGAVTILHSFRDGSVTNDGSLPASPLLQGYDGNFYGMTFEGGSAGNGTVFEMTPQGTVTILHNFGDGSVANDGDSPDVGSSGLIQSTAGNFYGVTTAGGISGNGTIFSIIASQTAIHVPIFTGSAYTSSSLYTPLSFTPTAAFGVSGSGTETGAGIWAEIRSFLPQIVRKAVSPTNWTLTGTLPLQLTFDPTSGTITGTPTQAGTFTVTLTPNNSVGSGMPQVVTIYIDVPPSITSGLTATGSVGTPFSYQITSLPPAIVFGATNLPAWMSVDSTTGIISGTPPAGSTFFFNAVAANASGQTSQQVMLTVGGGSGSAPAITSATTAIGTAGTAFTYQIATNPRATSYSAVPMPTGLLFDSTAGTILGTPTTAGTFPIPIAATNVAGTSASVLSLMIAPVGVPVLNSTLSATAGKGVAFTYQIPATGIIGYYGATGLPTGLSLNTFTGVISGAPTANGTYSITVTASNGTGTSSATLTLQVGASFSDWESANGITGAPTATPENDGVPNLFKYLYDINPTRTMTAADRAALPVFGTTTISSSPYLTLTYRQYTLESGITVNVQTSFDLKTWTTVANPTVTQTGTDSNTGDAILQVQVPVTGTTEYIRLNVTQP